MIVSALIDGRLHTFNTKDTRRTLGEGGEAVVMSWDPHPGFAAAHGDPAGTEYVVKLYFTTGATPEETAVRKSAAGIRQQKLPSFPSGLPRNAISPTALVRDRQNQIIGYVMPRVRDTKPLCLFMDPDFRRDNGVTQEKAVKVLLNLHALVLAVHKAGIVLGDFNDKNVLVSLRTLDVYIVDMDAAQWGPWVSHVAEAQFADPTLLDESFLLKNGKRYSTVSDWYSFTVMVYQLLTLSNPYRDGAHLPRKRHGQPLPPRRNFPARVTHRVSTFDPDVRLDPRMHRPSSLPEQLGLFMRETFTRDRRVTVFPIQLLTQFRWMTCPKCRREHGRTECPNRHCKAPGFPAAQTPATPRPTPPAPSPVIPAAPSGSAAMRRPVRTDTTYVTATASGGCFQYVHYTNGAYRREDNSVVWQRSFVPGMSVLVAGDRTVFAFGSEFAVRQKSGAGAKYTTQNTFGRTTVATNSRHIYWLSDNSLMCDGVRYGQITPHMTSVWAGENFGVVLVQAGILAWVQTFDANSPGFTGSFYLPPSVDTLVGAQCVVGEKIAWLVVSYRATNGTITYKCFVIDAKANLQASAEGSASASNWMTTVSQSALAVGEKLLIPVTGTGIARIGLQGNALTHEGTHRGITSVITDARATVGICFTPTGLVHVGRKAITPIA